VTLEWVIVRCGTSLALPLHIAATRDFSSWMTTVGDLTRMALIGCALSASVRAQTGVASPKVLGAQPGSSLTIRGSTTIGARWHCTSSGVESHVAVAERVGSNDASALPDVRGVTLQLPVSALRCQSGPMERAMRRALKADRDTAALAITGRFEIPDDLPPAQANVRDLVGALRVAGMERNVFLRAKIEYLGDGGMRVQSTVPLTLSSFGITPPRVLFGTVRARDAITVEVDLRYSPP
jgi:hypothetical protein